MTPEKWRIVQEVFSAALDLQPGPRAEFLEKLADQDIANEVRRLEALHNLEINPVEQLLPPIQLLESAQNQHSLFPGAVLDTRYEIVRFLGSGGMGEVYEAEDRKSGDRIALKTLHQDLSNLAWLKREVQTARMVDHPNVCQVFAFVQTKLNNGTPLAFLTMELLEGETLRQRLKKEGAMSPRSVLPLLRQIVAGLTAAHQAGVIHRDLKPGNIMLVPRIEGADRLVITDFGLARQTDLDRAATRTRTSLMSAGTPAYVAPEQMQGQKPGPAADVYSLGVVIFEMLTGELPHDDSSPLAMAAHKLQRPPIAATRFAPSINRLWSRTIRKCLEVNPRKRFRTPRDVMAALEARTRWRLLWRLFIKRRKYFLFATGLLTLVAIAGILIAWAWPVDESDEARRSWREGIQTLHAGDPAAAVRILEDAAKRYRMPASVEANLAQAWIELGLLDRANAALRAAEWRRQSPRDTRLIQSVRAQLRGDVKGAKIALDGVTEFVSELAFLTQKHNPSEAPLAWAKVLQLEPQNAAAMLRLAMSEHGAEAEEHFLAAATLFRGRNNQDGVRLVSAAHGLEALKQGRLSEAQMDLANVVLSRPLALGRGACERTLTLIAGVQDNFALPPDPIEFPAANTQSIRIRKFDEEGPDKVLAVSFPVPPLRVCDITVEAHIRRQSTEDGSLNDTIEVGVAGRPDVRMRQLLWRDPPNLTERTFVLDITGDYLTRILSAVNQKSPTLDILIEDETAVDYVRVTFVY